VGPADLPQLKPVHSHQRQTTLGAAPRKLAEGKFDSVLYSCAQTKNEAPIEVTKRFPSGSIPVEPGDSVRRQVKRTMKSVQSPYEGFKHHYPLEECLDIYMELWYDSDSSSP